MNAEAHERNTAVLGMWIFLATEALLFSVPLLSLAIYRNLHPQAFAEGTRHLSRFWGTANTAVLLTSSWTMAMAVHLAERREPRRSARLLALTFLLGALFLGIKGWEYFAHWREGLFPGLRWDPPPGSAPAFKLFFTLYFLATGLHALHLTIGCALAASGSFLAWSKRPRSHRWIENFGLYWHFVDLIWIWLYPLLYLVGRSP